MKPRFVYIHGNGTSHWSFGWAKWLQRELISLGYDTFFETMPDSVLARSDYWLPFMKDHIQIGENDIIIGWSSGATAAMRYAESNQILGSILISPSCTDLGDVLEKQSGYYDESWNWDTIRSNQRDIALIYGGNDPYIPQSEFEYIAQSTEARVIAVPAGDHFNNQNTFPELMDYIRQMYGRSV